MTILPPSTHSSSGCLTTMTESNEPSQKSLEDIAEIDKTLQELGKWLQKAKFEPEKTQRTESCAEKMPAVVGPLFDALGFKVTSLNSMCMIKAN